MASTVLDMSFGLCYGNNCGSFFRLKNRSKPCIYERVYPIMVGKKQDQKMERDIKISVTENGIKIPGCQKGEYYTLPPLVRALRTSAKESVASFHFPGHNRGQAAPSSLTHLIGLGPFLHDLPELPELDNLFAPEGPILQAQKEAAELFGASETWFLVGGSTCGIQAAVMATCSPGDTIIVPRNCHISAISAMVLSGALPKYVYPEYNSHWDIAGGITPLQVENALEELEMEGRKAAAVLLVSPTYHGICSNVSEISKLCHLRNVPVIVDEAHGAHLGLHPQLPSSALHQGADLVVQSTHKVLCSLTQSSMLHMSGKLVDREKICRCLQTLQSSSPSYLLLASLDAARAQLSENREHIFEKAIKLAVEAKNTLNLIPGISVLDLQNFSNFPAIEPLRITIGTWKLGLSGFEADEILSANYGVIPELVETRSITLAINLGTQREHVLTLVAGVNHLSTISSREGGPDIEATYFNSLVPLEDSSMILSPREAFFAPKTEVNTENSVGKICGELICPYPPGIPVLIPGEVITERTLSYLLQVRSMGADISGAADPHLTSLVVCKD